MTPIKFKKRDQLLVEDIDWNTICNNPDFSTEYCNKVIDKIKNGITYHDTKDNIRKAGEDQAAVTYRDLCKYLLSAGHETATSTKKKREGWYWYSRDKIHLHSSQRKYAAEYIKTTLKLD